MLIVKLIFAIAFTINSLWLCIGIPTGTILLIVHFITKKEDQKKKIMKWVKICFLSLPVMIGICAIWALIALSSTFLGYPTTATIPNLVFPPQLVPPSQ